MDYVAAIVPSIGVLALFIIAMRGIFHADQRERLAQAQIERAERAEQSAPTAGRPADSSGNHAAGGGTE
jgi:hypothetical protein